MALKNSGMILFACAGLLLGGGTILGVSAGWSVMRMSHHVWTTELGVELSCTVLLVAGCVLCLPTCWLATIVPYQPRATSPAITLMFLSTGALLLLSTGLLSLTSLSAAIRDHSVVNKTMYSTMARVPLDYSYWLAFNSMQLELKCCGVQSYTDWYNHGQTLPAACCNRLTANRLDSCEKVIFPGGCLVGALLEIRYFVNSMSALTCVNIVILAATLFAAAYSLVKSVMERGDLPSLKSPIRLTCLHAPVAGQTPFLFSALTPANSAPLAPMVPMAQ